MPQIGWIGTGNLGAPMLERLSQMQETPVLAYNRTASKVPVGDKITVAKSNADLSGQSDIIFTSLNGDKIVRDVYENDIFPHAKPGAFVIEASTIFPDLAADLFKTAQAKGLRFAQCPLFGPPPAAKSGMLIVSVSGSDEATVKGAESLFVPTIARKAFPMVPGLEGVRHSASFKLLGNTLVLGFIEVMAEAMTLGDKTGVSADTVREFIKEMFPLPLFQLYADRMLHNKYISEVSINVPAGLKDASHIRNMAAEADGAVPVIDLAHKHLVTSRAHGGNDYDWSSVVRALRVESGLPAEREAK